MNETRDRLDRLIRRVRALRADADRLRPYALDVASKAAEVCVQSYHLRNEARTLVSQMVSRKFTGVGQQSTTSGRELAPAPPGDDLMRRNRRLLTRAVASRTYAALLRRGGGNPS